MDRNYAKNKDGVRLITWEEEFKTLSDKLKFLQEQGFKIVPFTTTPYNLNQKFNNNFVDNPIDELEYSLIFDIIITSLKESAKKLNYPIDGIVFKYNDCAYYNSLGATTHHPNGAIAFKFADDLYETVLRDVEWSMGRTGVLTPIAIFDEVDTGDSLVTRASLHNISIIPALCPPKKRANGAVFGPVAYWHLHFWPVCAIIA